MVLELIEADFQYYYSDEMGRAIAQGITKTGVAVELVNWNDTEPQEVREIE